MNFYKLELFKVVGFIALLLAGQTVSAQNSFTPEQVLSAAKSEEKRSDCSKALPLYRKALGFRQTQEAATVGVAHCLLVINQTEEAFQIASNYLKTENPFQVDLHLALSEVYQRRGDFQTAMTEVKTVEKLHPNYVPAWERKGLVHYDLGEFEKAAQNLTDYLKENPRSWFPRFRRAQSYFNMGKYDSCVSDLKTLIEDKPTQMEYQFLLADSYKKMNNHKEEERVLTYILKITPNSADALLRMAAMNDGLGKWDESVNFYKRYLEIEPSKVDIGQKLATAYKHLKMTKQVEDEYTRELRVRPDFDPAAEGLVELWTAQNKFDRVGFFLKEYAEHFPGKHWAVKKYVEMLVNANQASVADAYLERNTRAVEPSADTFALWAWVKKQNGNLDDGIEVLYDGTKKYPKDNFMAYNLGLFYEEKGDSSRAMRAYQEVPANSPVATKAKINLALLYEKNLKFKEALKVLNTVPSDDVMAPSAQAKVVELEAKINGNDRGVSSEKGK